VHKLDSNGSAVDASRFLGELAVGRQIRVWYGAEKAERIEVGLKISPTTKCVEHTFAFSVGCVQYCG